MTGGGAADDADLAGMTVLVVEDYDSARKAFCLIVRSYGAVAHGAANGEEALRLAEAHPPDVVFCDIRLPGMDGFELLARLRGISALREVPVVAMSGASGAAERERIASAGFAAHLMKPVAPDVLAEQLRGIRRRE